MKPAVKYVTRVAEALTDEMIGYLRGDHESYRARDALKRHGLIDDDGRYTELGAKVARYVAQMVAWTEDDSVALSAAIVAHDGRRMDLRGTELAEAVRMMAARGLTGPEMAQRLVVGRDRIAQVAREHGISVPARRVTEATITAEDKRKIMLCPLGQGRVWVESW